MEPNIYTTDTSNENGSASFSSGTTQVSFEVNCYQDTPKNLTPSLNSLKINNSNNNMNNSSSIASPLQSNYTSPTKRGSIPSLSPILNSEGGKFGHHRRTHSNTTYPGSNSNENLNNLSKSLSHNNSSNSLNTNNNNSNNNNNNSNNNNQQQQQQQITDDITVGLKNLNVDQKEHQEEQNNKTTTTTTTTTTKTTTNTTNTTNTKSKDINSENEKDSDVEEFVIIGEFHQIDYPILHDNYGFLVDQEQIQNYLIYKDKFHREEQVRRDQWNSYLEKNPGALQNLVVKQPHHIDSNYPISQISGSTGVKSYRQKIPKPFKELIRSGIPEEYRSIVWFRASGGYARLSENPDEYERILRENKGKKSISIKQIMMDVDRTFPEHKFLNTKEKMESLTNVLVAYSWRNPNVGYCQCMNFIAGFLLIFMSEPEAYWTLVSIVEELLPTEYFTSTMMDSSVDVRFVFDDLLQKKIPRLHSHLTSHNLTLPLIITQWFLCIMATSTPTETCFRIWDVFFSEGSKVLFRVALSFFKLSEEKILSCSDYGTLYNLIKKIPSVMYDADLLLDVSFKRLGSFPMKSIIQKRKDSKHIVINEFLEFQKQKSGSNNKQ